MNLLPRSLADVIEALGTMPGVGPRTAERYAYFLLKADKHRSQQIADALAGLHAGTKYCPVTFALINSDEEISRLYTDPTRDKTIVAIVADPFDVIALEKTGQYSGTYHVLGGLISPIDGITPDSLHMPELLKRVHHDNVAEIILATSASVEGESTALYISKQLEHTKISITRLARGLPIGLDLEYADQITLGRALSGRQAA